MNEDSVRKYVRDSKAVFDLSPQMDEANTKAAVLRDFLDLLGWQIPGNTQLEYSVEAFGRTYKVDYALILDGTPVAFLEAKGLDTSLTSNHNEQLSSYMMNKNVNYGILTNGEKYRFFQRRVNSSNVDIQQVGDLSIEELPDRLAVLNAYQKDAIESGESNKILGRINELREALQTLKTQKDDLADEFSNVLSDRVSDAISSLAEPQSKEMIDRLVSDIEAEIDADVDDTGGSSRGGGSGVIEPRNNYITGKIRRKKIGGDDDEATVAVFPTRPSGLPFLKENNAWGFVRVGREFDYVAMYVARDPREVKYFATVRDVVRPEDANLERPPLEYIDMKEVGDGKMVIRFESGSLYELEDPVPYKKRAPQSLQYTTLGALRTAKTTDDML